MAPLEAFHQKLLAAGIGPDKPLHAVLVEVRRAAQELTEKAAELKTQPVDQIARDVRRVLREEVAPEFLRRWQWDRWLKVAALVVSYTALVIVGTYFAARSIENARLDSWCSDRAHVVGSFCQVPLR